MPHSSYVWMGNTGCLLPVLIIFNLFFGRLIFESTGLWLGVEAVLVLIFIFKIKLLVSRISRQFKEQSSQAGGGYFRGASYKPTGKVIDIQGQEIKDEGDKVKRVTGGL